MAESCLCSLALSCRRMAWTVCEAAEEQDVKQTCWHRALRLPSVQDLELHKLRVFVSFPVSGILL
jgi:hypothetical protein